MGTAAGAAGRWSHAVMGGKTKRARPSYSSTPRMMKPRVGLPRADGSVPLARDGWSYPSRPCFGYLRQAHQRMRHSTGLTGEGNTTCANFPEGLAGLTGQRIENRSRLILVRCAGSRAPRVLFRPTADGVTNRHRPVHAKTGPNEAHPIRGVWGQSIWNETMGWPWR